MRTLYIVRHAKSSWSDSSLSDSERPLNGRGRRNAPEMGKRMKARKIRPDLLISSRANRALTTAKLFSKELDIPMDSIEISEDLYHTSAREMLRFIQSLDNASQSVMIFGHNPGFTSLANLLTGSDIYNIPTAGVVTCQFDVQSWEDIKPATGNLSDFDYPKKEKS